MIILKLKKGGLTICSKDLSTYKNNELHTKYKIIFMKTKSQKDSSYANLVIKQSGRIYDHQTPINLIKKSSVKKLNISNQIRSECKKIITN
jgi:hypothetical protein